MFYPSTIRVSDLPSAQDEVASIVMGSNKEVQPQDLAIPGQQEPTKETDASQELPSAKVAIVPEAGAAS